MSISCSTLKQAKDELTKALEEKQRVALKLEDTKAEVDDKDEGVRAPVELLAAEMLHLQQLWLQNMERKSCLPFAH